MITKRDQAAAQLLRHFRATDPKLYGAIMARRGRNALHGMGEVDFGFSMEPSPADVAAAQNTPPPPASSGMFDWVSGAITTISNAASKLGPAYLQYKTQKDVMDLQLDRARRGLPPLDASMYSAPPMVVAVQPQFDPGTQRTAQQAMWIGAAIIGAIILIPLLSKRR